MRFFLSLSLIVFVLTSCSSTFYTQTDAVIPAAIQLPEDMASIEYIDRSRPADFKTRLNERLETGMIVGDELGGARDDMFWTLKTDMPVNGTIRRKELKDAGDSGRAGRMSMAKMQEMTPVGEGIFSLEEFQIRTDQVFAPIQKHQLDSLGRDYVIDAVHAVQTTTLSTYWRLYDPRDGQVMMEFPRLHSHVAEAEGLDQGQAMRKLEASNRPSPKAMAQLIAKQMAIDFSPAPITSHWLYFKRGHAVIERSANLLSSGRFQEAIHLLEKQMPSIDKDKHRERAMHNLATCYALKGDRATARKMAQDYLRRTGNKEFKRLLHRIDAGV